jgi:hypothetical protein
MRGCATRAAVAAVCERGAMHRQPGAPPTRSPCSRGDARHRVEFGARRLLSAMCVAAERRDHSFASDATTRLTRGETVSKPVFHLEQKSAHMFVGAFAENRLDIGGVDGTRTRDPRRDRPVF